KFPAVSGYVLDLAGVVEFSPLPEQFGVADRVEKVPGDFFTGDGWPLNPVFPLFPHQQSIEILKNLARVAAPHTKLLNFDWVVPEVGEPETGERIVDIRHERTAQELTELFAKGGWKITRFIGGPGVGLQEAVLA
ncbi:hypothetical protein BDK51DRAFT_28338, partial [Blyttiomyces helicus]